MPDHREYNHDALSGSSSQSQVTAFEETMMSRRTTTLLRLNQDPNMDVPSQEAAEAIAARARQKPVSLLRKRFQKFRSLKRGYYSFVLLMVFYALSFALPVVMDKDALIVHYQGETYFPVFTYYEGSTFGQDIVGETNYRKLEQAFEEAGGDNWVLMPFYSWDPYESDFDSYEPHPQPPSANHWLGTDDTGRDVLSRMAYGFNISISFALLLTLISYIVGGFLGGVMGFYGGKFDLYSQRIVEIWSNIPFLYTVIIISSLIIPGFAVLIFILALFRWIGISYYMRGEFYREKARDYVAAAISMGAKDREIIFKHILPNSLTPMISFLPFTIVTAITSLVSLDYLGFGLPPPTPSWGQMVDVGLGNMEHWWLVITPLTALFLTLLLVTFIGEAIREAFDPKVFSRLR